VWAGRRTPSVDGVAPSGAAPFLPTRRNSALGRLSPIIALPRKPLLTRENRRQSGGVRFDIESDPGFSSGLGGRLDEHPAPPKSEIPLVTQDDQSDEAEEFPREIAKLLDAPGRAQQDLVWDSFLNSFGDLLLKTAAYSHRRHSSAQGSHDASMDAYAFILEKLRQDDYRRLRRFTGGDREAFSRWLVVVARRLCTDFWRIRYGRARPSTPDLDRDTRRRLVDEIWDPRDSSELPTPKRSDPEWELRYRERREALESALGDLEPKNQLLLAYRFEDGLSARRISELLDFPTPFHVYRQLTRVLQALRDRLEEMGFDDPDP